MERSGQRGDTRPGRVEPCKALGFFTQWEEEPLQEFLSQGIT